MSRRMLLEDDYRENDEIVLCENFSPNGQPFYLWQDKMIDWDSYELYINVDISAITWVGWRNILIISSTDITSWGGTGKLHLYSHVEAIRIQPVEGDCVQTDTNLSKYNKQKLQITINKNGVYLEENLMFLTSSHPIMQKVMYKLKTSNVTIGSAIPSDPNICTYNKVSLRKYVERN